MVWQAAKKKKKNVSASATFFRSLPRRNCVPKTLSPPKTYSGLFLFKRKSDDQILLSPL